METEESNGVRLAWDITDDGGAPITAYTLQVRARETGRQ